MNAEAQVTTGANIAIPPLAIRRGAMLRFAAGALLVVAGLGAAVIFERFEHVPTPGGDVRASSDALRVEVSTMTPPISTN